MHSEKYDYVVVGSGFGGSVSALRLAEKGYRVLVIEKGKWYHSKDFPKTNMNLRKWLWLPSMRFFGFFKLTFLRHVGILTGVGVGGGSLVYANTLPVPKPAFFTTGTWAELNQWEAALKPFYERARSMLGVATNPKPGSSDIALKELSENINRKEYFEPTDVAVYFGAPGETVPDPYFNGKGPNRSGCTFCGACMTGCRENAKNSLDKNYLYLAQQYDCKIIAEQEVYNIIPHDEKGDTGYTIEFKNSTQFFKSKKKVTAKGVVLAGGVLGTVKLLYKLKKTTMPGLSDMIGHDIRTNNESLVGVPSLNNDKDYTTGIAIGSILHTDRDSHLEPVRYGRGSIFWRFMMLPMTRGRNIAIRIINLFLAFLRSPLRHAKILTMWKFSTKTPILLFMQHLDSTLLFKPGFFGLNSKLQDGPAPTADNPPARKLANEYASIINGEPYVTLPESLLGIPTTAHILGGAVMGESVKHGVVDSKNCVYGYTNIHVCDGSMISANPGVNPSLTITAISEYAMEQIPEKNNC